MKEGLGDFLEAFCLGMMVVCAISASFLLGYKQGIDTPEEYNNQIIEDKNIITNISACKNLSLTNTTICLNDWVKGFFNYTIRDDTIKPLEDIMKNGGDCYDYSNLYVMAASELNFSSTTMSVPVKDNIGHTFPIIYDETGYCLVDQTNKPYCLYYGTINKTTNETGVKDG